MKFDHILIELLFYQHFENPICITNHSSISSATQPTISNYQDHDYSDPSCFAATPAPVNWFLSSNEHYSSNLESQLLHDSINPVRVLCHSVRSSIHHLIFVVLWSKTTNPPCNSSLDYLPSQPLHTLCFPTVLHLPTGSLGPIVAA